MDGVSTAGAGGLCRGGSGGAGGQSGSTSTEGALAGHTAGGMVTTLTSRACLLSLFFLHPRYCWHLPPCCLPCLSSPVMILCQGHPSPPCVANASLLLHLSSGRLSSMSHNTEVSSSSWPTLLGMSLALGCSQHCVLSTC